MITTILAFMVMRRLWSSSLPRAIGVAAFFLVIDSAFLAVNLVKVADGGWFPLLIGTGVVVLMTSWRTGRQLLVNRLRAQAMITFEELTARLESRRPVRVPGTGIYMTGHPEWVPAAVNRLLQGQGRGSWPHHATEEPRPGNQSPRLPRCRTRRQRRPLAWRSA